jgi:hypothetical protein
MNSRGMLKRSPYLGRTIVITVQNNSLKVQTL